MRSFGRNVAPLAAAWLAVTALTTVPAAAQSVSVKGQVRPRAVVDSGRDFIKGGVAEREHINQRSRLWADVSAGEGKPWLRVMLQDVRTWGEETSAVHDKSAQGLDIQEAFFVVPTELGLSLKIGRQELIYDNHRLIGNIGWLQRAQSFDGVRAIWKLGAVTLDSFAVMVRERDDWDGDGTPSGATADTRLGGIQARWTNKKAGKPNEKPVETAKASLSWFVRDDDVTGELRSTIGTIAWARLGGLTTTLEAYYQLGSLQGGETIGAYLGAIDVEYGIDAPLQPLVGVFADVLSGDGAAGSAFDTLAATNHKFYGEMDFFLAIPKHTANLGLMDIGAKVVARRLGPAKLFVTFHQLMAATADARGESTFGQEIDVKIAAKVAESIGVRALYGVFVPGEAMRTARGIATGITLHTEHFAYLTLDAQF